MHDLSSSPGQIAPRRRRRGPGAGGRRALLTVAVAAVLALAAQPAAALQTAAPLQAAGGAGGCVRDVFAPNLGGCPRPAPGLDGADAVALVDGGRHLAVAAPGSDAVTFLARTPGSGALARGFCISAPGVRGCPLHAVGLHGAAALAPSAGALDVGSHDDRAVVALHGPAVIGCISAAPIPGCALRDGALGHVAGLAVSPDGRTVYAASYGGDPGRDTVVALTQRPARRSIRLLQPVAGGCAQSLGPGGAWCPRTTGLQGAVAVAVSPDGRSVYTAASVSSAVVHFVRNPATGAINAAECVGDATRVGAGDTPCAVRVPGMRGAAAIAVSPDGSVVYVASSDPGAVVALARDPATGALRPLGGATGCLTAYALPGCTTVPALRGAAALAFAPGGRELDVAAPGADAVVPLQRDAAGGLSAPAAVAAVAPVLNGIGALAPFGRQLYGASAVDDGVIVLQRGR